MILLKVHLYLRALDLSKNVFNIKHQRKHCSVHVKQLNISLGENATLSMQMSCCVSIVAVHHKRHITPHTTMKGFKNIFFCLLITRAKLL